MLGHQPPENEKIPCEKRQRDQRNFESQCALPESKSTISVIHSHGNQPNLPLLKYAIDVTLSSQEFCSYNLPGVGGGKTTRTWSRWRKNQQKQGKCGGQEEDEEKLLSDISATNSEDKEERRMGKTVFVLYNNKKEMKDELQRRITSRYIHHN